MGLAACGVAALSMRVPAGSAEPPASTRHILVDQFGYRPEDPKVAVIRSPQVGYDAGDPFQPGPRYEVRRVDDGKVVLDGTPVAWNGGAVEASSGDRGWWFDFSRLAVEGRYQVVDVERGEASAPFSIDADVYRKVLRAALRTFYYQRSGLAKRPPFAEACWSDGAAYAGPGQDTEAHDVTDRGNAAKVRELGGGWFDAGDTNKYVVNAAQPVHQLLNAYAENPEAFGDDLDIPESGNGIPDVIDEVKWELDWLKKMQFEDGSVSPKLGDIVFAKASPPSSDGNARYYIPGCTSATIAAAGMYAHAAVAFRKFPALARDAAELKERALRAWKNYDSAPFHQTHCDSGAVKAGNADQNLDDQNAAAVVAAIYLFAATGDRAFDDYVQLHYRETRPYRDVGWSRYNPEQGEALLFYATLPEAGSVLKRTVVADKRRDIQASNRIYGFEARDDLYRAFLHDEQYHWGSNNPRANYGNSNLDAARIDPSLPGAGSYRLRALEIVHYFHGVNPFGMVYLSNMYPLGATRSVNRIFHAWYQSGSRWSDARESQCGPAPGFVPGGPNANAVRDGVPSRLSPPNGQPPQKSYKDWNEGTPENSWAVTEPGIYYQSAYVELLSAFAGPRASVIGRHRK